MSREEVEAWVRQLREGDAEQDHQQAHRDKLRGKLNTAGRGGEAPRVDIDEAMSFAAGEIDLDERSVDDDEDD